MPFQTDRRSGRLPKQVPILLLGTNADGRVFSEATHTLVLSLHGAGILSAHALAPDQEMNVRSLESNSEALIRIVGKIGSHEKHHAYGVAFVDQQLDFWKVEFPLPPPRLIPHAPLRLECSLCNAWLVLEHGDFESDVCAIHGGLVRFCEKCTFSTVWKVLPLESPRPSRIELPNGKIALTDTAVDAVGSPYRPRSKSKLQTLDLPAEAIPEARANRRAHRRAKVNYCACVRSIPFGDDLVRCFDMSRGGVGFKSKNPYMLASNVQIAVPFSREDPQAPAIFVLAKIVACDVTQDRNFFRCGVAFESAGSESTTNSYYRSG
jgi:hypothetical protein